MNRHRATWPGVHAAFAVAWMMSFVSSASAFSLFINPDSGNPQHDLEQAGRWTSTSGGFDGIQVGVHGDAASSLSTQAGEDALIEQRISDAFAVWESPVLNFDLSFNAAGVVEGPESGFDIDLFAVNGTHPIFAGTSFFGFASVASSFDSMRTLTNGRSVAGHSITGVDLYLNIDILASLAPLGQALRLDALTRVLIHEIGHGIGLGHPNSNNPFGLLTYYDTDFDPFNAMPVDPSDPFTNFLTSNNRNDEAIMSNGPCGIPAQLPCDGAFFTSLQLDDIGGRDALYPAPEPSSGLLLAAGLAALARVRTKAR